MATTPRRLTDDQLSSTDLRITDPVAVDGYTRDRPDPGLAPEIIGKYDLTPPGGLSANPDGPWIWCCHCQEENHWRGFVITNETEKRYSIGGDTEPPARVSRNTGGRRNSSLRPTSIAWHAGRAPKADS